MATVDMKEIGSTGLKRSGGVVTEEYLTQLQGPRWWRVVREMQNDAIIAAVLLAIELSLRQVKVEVEPMDDTPAAGDVAEFVEGCLTDMSSSWADTLSEILSLLSYGYSYLELVYKRRMGDNQDAGKSSKYDDGLIGWRKWAIRAQDSLYEWAFDDKGGLQGFKQFTDTYTPVLIPISKSLLFRTTSRKNNPEGDNGVLRHAYESWYYKRNIARIEAIGIERDMAGLPVAYIPPEFLSASATQDQQAFLAAIKEIVTNIRNDEQAGIVFPLAYTVDGSGKQTSNKMFELTLLASGGQRQFDTDAVIARYNQQISMSVLADFIMLGHEQTGSYALSATKSSLFKTALEAWLQAIADVINTHAIPRLMRLNGMAMELMPKVKFGRVGEVPLEDIVTWMEKFTNAGGQLFPNLATENHLRGLVGLDALSEEEFTQREEEAQQQREADRQATARQPQGNQQQDAQMSAAHAALLEAAQRIVVRGA